MGQLAKLRCNSCGGTYPDTRKEGVTYFHVCPDQIVDQPEQLDEHKNIVTPATFKAVDNPRNENLKPHPEKPGEQLMISEGSGVTEVQ